LLHDGVEKAGIRIVISWREARRQDMVAMGWEPMAHPPHGRRDEPPFPDGEPDRKGPMQPVPDRPPAAAARTVLPPPERSPMVSILPRLVPAGHDLRFRRERKNILVE